MHFDLSSDVNIEFGRRLGIPDTRIERILDKFAGRVQQVGDLLKRSFLDKEFRERFLRLMERRGEDGGTIKLATWYRLLP